MMPMMLALATLTNVATAVSSGIASVINYMIRISGTFRRTPKKKKKSRSDFSIPTTIHKSQDKQTRTPLPHFCSKANTLLSKQATP
jgi:hypothetical protein